MKYPEKCTNIIDVTKPPYCADNTGKTDCTTVLCKVINDVLIRHIEATEDFANLLYELSEEGTEDVYVGFESGYVINGDMRITWPLNEPSTKIIYFPAGTYLVSDTITYTLTNLKNKYYHCPDYDLSRNIHFLGESRENTVIRLADNSFGFDIGGTKPLLSFNTNNALREKEVSNTSQMCMLENITLDMGKGNGGVGVRYHSSNNGRIENVTIKAESGTAGIFTVYGSEACFCNIKISGFDYGMDIAYSQIITVDKTDVCDNRIAGVITNDSALVALGIYSGNIRTFSFRPGKMGRYYFADKNITFGDANGNFVYTENDFNIERCAIPENPYKTLMDDCAFVDDYGAIADGKTDSSRAIRRAFNSGKPIVLFGEGVYCINESVKIPKSVKYIDFNFCDLASGSRLIGGEYDCAFEIAESSEDVLFVENLYTGEHFFGHIRLLKHSCVRDVVLSDLQTTMASLYFNTVPGSKVFLENIFLTTGTYCKNLVLHREGMIPVYSSIIPLEFHAQTVMGRCVNPERADIALLNDASQVLIDGYRTEGSGTAAKTVNGGTTVINVFNAGLGYKKAENSLFEAYDSNMVLTGIYAYGFDEMTEYNILIQHCVGETETVISWDEIETKPQENAVIVHRYR